MSHHKRTRPLARFNDWGEVTLTFPYHQRLVARLKAEIPAHARRYDPRGKAWTVSPVFAAHAIALLRATYPDSTIEHRRDRPAPQPVRRTDHAFAVFHLLPSAPPALLEAAYRVLARLCHPDVAGGDGERMRELNDAYAAVKAKVSA